MIIEAINELKKYTLGKKNTEKVEISVLQLNRVIKALEQEPYEDAISRKAVLEQTYDWSKDEFLRVTNPFDYLRKRINSLPSVNTIENMNWISIEKYGYPKPEDEYKRFLTIDNRDEVTIQEFLLSIDEEPQPYFTGWRNIVAWMPLPKPYESQENEET